MRVSIENEQLKAEIESFGAELKSLIRKEENQEYMWEGIPPFWRKTSPILFPFIGQWVNSSYRYHGKEYETIKHGFAREMDFRVTLQEKDRVIFAIESTKETLERFPFPFMLEIEYRLEDNSLTEQWRVHNKGSETMYFSIGGHPAFSCPPFKNGVREGMRTDCAIKTYGTEGKTVLHSTEITMATGLLSGEQVPINVKDGVFPIAPHIFERDALVFAEEGVKAVGLLDKDGKEYMRLESENCPVWGIWSMRPDEAPYVCIEPWWGICDSADYQGTLEERPYTNHVEAGEVWQEGFRIVVEG